MSQRKKTNIDIERLRKLEPIAALSEERLQELLPLTDVERIALGGSLFREGDIDNQTIYLLQGDVHLSSSNGRIDRTLSARDEAARFPLDDSQPRQATAIALSRVEIVRIDNNVLDYMMTWDQLAVSEHAASEETSAETEVGAPEMVPEPAPETPPVQPTTPVPTGGAAAGAAVAEAVSTDESPEPAPVIEPPMNAAEKAPDMAAAEPTESKSDHPEAPARPAEGNWIRRMRHIMAFKTMPPANIKRLLERMESVEVKAGERIIEQGEPGDYYYVLTDGQAKVTRTVELATLEPGISFGEEALISGGRRNASVTMLTDGVVMRLSKADFDELLREPMLQRLSPDEARVAVAGGARWLDVRHAREFHHSHLPKALNIPLHELRMRLDELDPETAYVCYCGTGRRSSAAAFLLAQKGFQASVLSGGIRVMAQELVTKD